MLAALLPLMIPLVLAVALLAVVAISAGQLRVPGGQRVERVVDVVDRHLNGQGTPPRVFERLDRHGR